MQLGFVGLGRMGLNMVTRLARGGHSIVAFDRSADAVAKSVAAGAKGASSLEALRAGHYVKMIHNGIEYGMMQAYAEGFELMHDGSYTLDVGAIAALWQHGSVVRSWLLDLTARALAEDRDLADLESYVEDSGEGRWTVQEGIEKAVPLPVLTAALFTRFRSRADNPFAERMLAALRQQFGGHAVKTAAGAESPSHGR